MDAASAAAAARPPFPPLYESGRDFDGLRVETKATPNPSGDWEVAGKDLPQLLAGTQTSPALHNRAMASDCSHAGDYARNFEEEI
jgi:hypothetical protein